MPFLSPRMDPFVSGSGLLRNYYFTMTGPCKPRVPNRATLNFGFGSFGERDLLNVRAIALLNKNQSFSGDLPLETWDTLASQPGRCWIQAHYRGETPPGEFSRPFVSQSLHSNFVEVTVTPCVMPESLPAACLRSACSRLQARKETAYRTPSHGRSERPGSDARLTSAPSTLRRNHTYAALRE